MRNRAKCKLCGSILESFHRYDYVSCKCDEIAISGGQDKLEVYYKNIDNLLRLDDEDNVIVVEENRNSDPEASHPIQGNTNKPTKKEKMEMLEAYVTNLENLPQNAMSTAVTHYDLYSLALLVSSLLRED